MAIKFETVRAGDVLYDYHSHGIGNTTMRGWSNWEVRVLSVRADHVIASWNNNTPERMDRHQVERLRRKPGKEK